jgi:transposase, IS5 family
METYLRLMFLKYRYRLGYEPLCAEVADSLTWRRFCRIPLGVRVPHPTTLMKITTRCGPQAAAAQRRAARTGGRGQAGADAQGPHRHHRHRGRCRVSDRLGLLAKAITRISATVKKVKAAGGASRTTSRDRSRSAGKRARSIAANLKRRSGEARDEVKRITADLAGLADTAAGEAQRVISNAKRALNVKEQKLRRASWPARSTTSRRS